MNSGWNEGGPGGTDDALNGPGAADNADNSGRNPTHPEADPSSMNLPMLVEQALNQVEQDRELLSEVVEIFVDTAPDLLNDLKRAATDADAEALRKAAHSLKGAAANICAEPMRATAFDLEQMGQDGALSDVEHKVTQLYRQFDDLRAFMESGLKDRLGGV